MWRRGLWVGGWILLAGLAGCGGKGESADSAVVADSGCGEAAEYLFVDGDGDGQGDAAAAVPVCPGEPREGLAAAAGDCDDADPAAYTGAAEVCDGRDNDCDGIVDDGPQDMVTVWRDGDGDGYGDPDQPYTGCEAPEGYVADGTDCDDGRGSIHPGAPEVCDGQDLDEDCDGLSDDADGDAAEETRYALHADADGDGYGAAALYACDEGPGIVADGSDCDDDQAAVNPGAAEVCDDLDVDEDCDGMADDADAGGAGRAGTWYGDHDGDGVGVLLDAVNTCDPPEGYVAAPGDCNDADPAIRPGGQEICDPVDADEDCNGISDDDDPAAIGQVDWYLDGDADDYGAGASVVACNAPFGYIVRGGDCDDGDGTINPDAAEVCADGVDQDCDGVDGGC